MIKMSIKEIDFIKKFNTIITNDCNQYYYVPYYFKVIDKDAVELVSFENLPKNVIDLLNQDRTNEKSRVKEID